MSEEADTDGPRSGEGTDWVGAEDLEAARTYAAWFETPLGQRVWADERRALGELLGPVDGHRMLDAGAGDGRFAVEASAEGAEVTALDLSPAMLSVARERARERSMALEAVEGDVTALPFPSSSFDRAVTVTVLCFVPDPFRAVQELARVLRPGGVRVIGELGLWSPWNLRRWLRGRRGDPMWAGAHFWRLRELRALTGQAGLRPGGWSSAVFYGRRTHGLRCWRLVERVLRGRTSLGATFLAFRAVKPGEG